MHVIDGWYCPDILSGPGKFLRRAQVISHALQRWSGPRRRAIQAGAHIGTFPHRLAQYFSAVTCVEPAPDNWDCLVMNTRYVVNIMRYSGILGAARGMAAINVQPHGTGGHHVMTREDRPHVPVMVHTIDGFGYTDVDAVFLDIEGFELFALQGAIETLAQCRPLLVIEDNGCSKKYGVQPGAVGPWLSQTLDYTLVSTYGEDSLFVPEMQ